MNRKFPEMTQNLVKRLREMVVGDAIYHPPICTEAADEIERLLAERVPGGFEAQVGDRLVALRTEKYILRAALAIAKDALERDTGNYSLVLQAIADALRQSE